MQAKNHYHYFFLALSLLLAVVCAVLMLRVNINGDMTKYLPDDSRMKQGLDILQTEFQSDQFSQPDVKILFQDLSFEERAAIADSLHAFDQVKMLSYESSDDGKYTLYMLFAPDVVDLKLFARSIAASFDNEVAIETIQDGATPPVLVLVIAAVLIFVVLIVMAQSWLDPLLSLVTIGIAIVINIGTNALLPSVSITTNYIVAILQMVLSLDYSIVLMNRYRQELDGVRTPVQSVNAALLRAYPSILSSAATTIVGLLVLVFMRLKIGMDLGLVLAKGVLCCLVCTFTVLPSLLLIFRKGLEKTAKKTFVLPTDRLSRFATGHKTSLAIVSVLLFVTAWYFSRKTDISFSTNGESKIAELFPQVNPFVVIYDKADEQAIITLADSLETNSDVQMILSYPTLLKKQFTADEMVNYVGDLSTKFGDIMPANGYDEMLTPEVLHIVYALHEHAGDSLRLSFPDIMQFIAEECVDNPLFADYLDDNMMQQMALLRPMLASQAKADSAASTSTSTEQTMVTAEVVSSEASEKTTKSAEMVAKTPPQTEQPKPIIVRNVAPTSSPQSNTFSIITFMKKLNEKYGDADTRYLVSIVDTTLLHKKMTVDEMARFVGSTHSQTKMVYSFSKSGKTMTPLMYVHFLADDLFQRKALASMVNADQKAGLLNVAKIMDYADQDAYLTVPQLTSLVRAYGLLLDENRVSALVEEKQVELYEPVELSLDYIRPEVSPKDSILLASDKTPEEPVDSVVPVAPIQKKKSVGMKSPRRTAKQRQAERQAAMFVSLMEKDTIFFTAEEMAGNFENLGQEIDTNMVRLLYTYYASVRRYDSDWRMSPEQLLSFVADTLVQNEYMTEFIPAEVRENTESTRNQLDSAMMMLSSGDRCVMVVLTTLPDESKRTYAFVDYFDKNASELLSKPYYMVGESVMFSEMKAGFSDELMKITLLTIIAIFLIIAISFRSLVVPSILVMTVMTAVFINVIFSGLVSGQILYLAYLIVQSILMGATIDYGILFANYYKENRKTLPTREAAAAAYKGSIRTIMTSGLIMIIGPGVMAVFISDVTISAIVGCLAVGASVAIALILVVLPGVLVAFDKLVVSCKVRKASAEVNQTNGQV